MIKKTLRYFSILLTIIVCYSIISLFNYPASWKRIELGDKRAHTLLNLGQSSFSQNLDVKGEFLIATNILFEHQLMIGYNFHNDTLINHKIIIASLKINPEIFHLNLRNEFQ